MAIFFGFKVDLSNQRPEEQEMITTSAADSTEILADSLNKLIEPFADSLKKSDSIKEAKQAERDLQ